MKRLHVHVGVEDIARSVRFYGALPATASCRGQGAAR